ncbi:serine/threonine protein kinase, negative regulator of sexual conjugation and meiosis [Serpula lacrymans var. lacrymans S7.9]|uniref:Serine/threonine protein kinase, negative regulator of sexual conjugation and meiosis n=2 Tax=Serpula lacrymans var. lacrymans TaxID=341189 RepID=F8NHY4_SERL9|nr:serine/threonine protein kinase, negative regulator of sexual conjugation and meiosis [Serpula lacrymans var. lacrymans S7.9]EGO30081.1 serine/threonine protein kinase, negative regulator of sexual conjugation and meiosis [Serpula lacrymans var. lacrymans S7.9]
MPSSPAVSSVVPSTPSPPALGTLIDNESLELVEVLGVGGYGVVYRAVDTRHPLLKSYAVKCLINSQMEHGSRQRQLHLREITLHRLASAHPNIVTLHRVVEEFHYTYIIMDFASDGDLFSQILHNCRYLGNDRLIKHIFLQLLDAVEYCHSLGIYHRDLKPENVLCFEGGLRIAITDFGLATTDRFSEEFRTGSVYHMSPECQGGSFAPTGSYSPLFNDIWSLAIILLNLATGRNPWKSASASDPTFQAYLQDPLNFLPTVLPISLEVNDILTRMLEVDWRQRSTLAEVRKAILAVDQFYAEGVIFEGSMARCPWELDVEIESDSDSSTKGETVEPEVQEELRSFWSKDSDLEMDFANNSEDLPWEEDYASCEATWAFESSIRSPTSTVLTPLRVYESATPPSTYSPLSPSDSSTMSSIPTTPESAAMPKNVMLPHNVLPPPTKPLKINTNCGRRMYYTATNSTRSISSAMHTAVESYNPYSSSFFLADASVSRLSLPLSSEAMPSSVDLGVYSTPESKGMDTTWDDDSETDYATSHPSASMNSSVVGLDLNFFSDVDEDSSSSNVDPWERHQIPPSNTLLPAILTSLRRASADDVSASAQKRTIESQRKSSGFFKFTFPRSASPRSSLKSNEERKGSPRSESFFLHSLFNRASSPNSRQSSSSSSSSHRSSPPSSVIPVTPPPSANIENCRQAARLRPKRRWFSPGKLFTLTGAS